MVPVTLHTAGPALNLMPAYPEIFLLLAACAILLIDMFRTDKDRTLTYWLSIISLVVCAGISTVYLAEGVTRYAFNDMFVVDPFANLLKVVTLLGTVVTLVYSRTYVVERGLVGDNVAGAHGGEFYALLLFATLGQMVMISSNNFLSIYLGLELMSLSLYAMVALRRDHAASTEAAMKYFILGALASGFLLYGMSMLYGSTGTLDLSVLAAELDEGVANRMILVFGLVFIVAGLSFKLGVAPFHMWIPDVYQGAPSAVTLVIAGAPKIAAFAIALRILVEGMITLAVDWQQMLAVMAIASLLIGNLAAIAQTSMKRLLGYSTISHMGFLLLGLLSGVVDGNSLASGAAYSAALFYSITYLVTTLAGFGVLILLSQKGFEADALNDFIGLHRRSPWAALVMLIVMFSLAGLPPTVGFYAKFAVLAALLGAGKVGLAVFAVLTSVVGAFYYLRVIRLMYFSEPEVHTPLNPSRELTAVLAINGAAVVLLGIVPGYLMHACLDVIASLYTT